MHEDIHKSDITIIGETNFRGMRRKFGIKRDDRRRHMYLVGKTGMGKSTVLENMIITDIEAGQGVAVVDPHGDLAEKIIKYIPSNRVNDVVYFNPSDTKHPVAFNILEDIGEDYKHLVAYGLVGVFKKIWADSWGPRMEYILTNTILALLDYPGSTLLGVMRLLVDKSYRKKIVAKIKDPVVKTFWSDEFANYSEKFRTEAIAPIQNKVGQFLSSSIIRNIVGQSKSTIEMRDLMDSQKILIMNLAKGRVGEENSALLGAMMITKIQIAAMSRVDISEDTRKDFYLYVDEFQNFATDSFAGILSEARKYRLNLIMAHQYLEQLGDEVKAAVFGNVGTMLIFRVGAADAVEMEPEFMPQFTAQDIVNVSKYNFIIRLMIDGIATVPFSGIGLAPMGEPTGNEDKVIKVSRERYARPRDLVEDRIIRWSGVDMESPLSEKAVAELEESYGKEPEEGEVDESQPVTSGPSAERAPAMKVSLDEADQEPAPVITEPINEADDQGDDRKSISPESFSLPRPKINFAQTATPAADPDQVELDAEMPKPEPEVAPEPVIEPIQESTHQPEVVQTPIVPKPPAVVAIPVNATEVSLRDLHTGNAPIATEPAKPSQVLPTPSTPTQSNGDSNSDSGELNGDGTKKKKRRRRKRKSGDEGSQDQSASQANSPSPTSSRESSVPNPVPKPTPPAEPTRQSATHVDIPKPEPKPSAPVQPAATTPAPSAPNPKTKVQLDQFM